MNSDTRFKPNKAEKAPKIDIRGTARSGGVDYRESIPDYVRKPQPASQTPKAR